MRRRRYCDYRNRTLAAPVAAAWLMTAALTAPAQEWTQTFDLIPGWNAIHLHIQPHETDPAVVFGDVSVHSVWTRGIEPSSVEFIDSPSDALLKQRGWLAYVPAGRDEAIAAELADNKLVSVEGNRAYLIRLEGEPTTLSISGRPLVPVINWQTNAFTLTGFPVDPADPPTFASYFAASSAHAGQPVYRLLADGTWQQIGVPSAAEMRYGEAYWVYSATGSDFIGPLAIEVPTSDGLSFGRGVSDYVLTFNNLTNTAITVGITDLASPAAVPLSYLKIVTEPGPELGEFQWIALTGTYEVNTPARSGRSTRLAARRGDLVSASAASVVAISNGTGMRWLLPVSVDSGIDVGPAAALSGNSGGGSPFTGLWIGGATINGVSQPQTGSMEPVPTTGDANICTGGPNEGMSCQGANDCPGRCTLTCAGGSNQGMPCTVAFQAGDCPGSFCIAQPQVCSGGINVGLACTSGDDCPGSSCESMGACDGGARVGQPCTAASEAEDCPGSTCNEGSRCDGGLNANRACSSSSQCTFRCDESGGGSEFSLRLLIHVDSVGRARLLKQVIQMWQNGTTKPDPDDPDFQIEDTPGRFVLITDDELIGEFRGASLRDGVPVGDRISSAHFDFVGNDLAMTGAFGGGNTLSASIILAPDFPTNPYRHKFHPDHDNLDAMGQPAVEAFEITREIDLAFSESDPSGLGSPDYGFDTVGGTYSEEIEGLHRNPIRIRGEFTLNRIATTPELNQ